MGIDLNSLLQSGAFSFIKLDEACEILGEKKSYFYAAIADGTNPPQIKNGKSSNWAKHEVLAILSARLSGATKDKQRDIVREWVAARPKISEFWMAALTAVAA